jgi:hypothetical protein
VAFATLVSRKMEDVADANLVLPNSGFVGDRAYGTAQVMDAKTLDAQRDDVEKENGTQHVESS